MSASAGPSNRPIATLPTGTAAGSARTHRPLLGRRSRGAVSAGSTSSARLATLFQDLEDDEFDLPSLPAGPYESSDAGLGGETDDDEVKVLEEAPEHLRKITNKDNPYVVDDSEDEDESASAPPPPPSDAAKRKRDTPPLDDDGWEIPGEDYFNFVEDAGEVPTAKRPRPERTSAADFLPDVLDIIPDLDVDTALATLKGEIEGGRLNECVERTIGSMLEMVGGYPKAKEADPKGKGKEAQDHPELYRDKTYRRAERLGPGYYTLCQIELEQRFVQVAIKDIRAQFMANQQLLVPTYLALQDLLKKDDHPFTLLKRARTSADKGKGRLGEIVDEGDDPFGVHRGSSEFYLEKEFLDTYLARVRVEADEIEAQRLAREMALANGEGIECGCCFGEETWDAIFQCSEGHLFCRECVKMHAETKLGEQKTRIDCMDGSGCPALFPESELHRLLSDKSLHLYHRLKQNAELAEAGIDGLESCPGCDYAAVIDNPEEKLFRCMNQSCMRVSCRKCQKPDHIPKTCEEAEGDKKLDKRHAVEEAMSEALIRKCPKCSQPYLKSDGCNKIMCSKCHTMSCYVCQKQITGYDHFDQGPGNPNGKGKCVLHDNNEAAKDHRAVLAARDAAQQGAREAAERQGLQLGDADIDVAAPDQPPGNLNPMYNLGAPRVLGLAHRVIGQPLAPYHLPQPFRHGAVPLLAGNLALGAEGEEFQFARQRIQDLHQRLRDDAARVQGAIANFQNAVDAAPGAPRLGFHLGIAHDQPIFGHGRPVAPLPRRIGRE